MVLDPLPAEYRDRMLELAGSEITERPLIGYCWDGVDQGEVETREDGSEVVKRPWAYEITQPSPRFPSRTVFAMFHWEEQRAVAAFTFEQVEVNGQQGVQFYRELIFDPKIASGPMTPKALFNEFMAFLSPGEGDDDEADERPAAANGARAS